MKHTPQAVDAVHLDTKANQVYEWLRGLIISGRLAPGELIDQQQAAETLGVSRMPLRQALLRLESDNLIDLRPRRQAAVTQLSAHELEQIYAMREALETMLVQIAAGNLTDAASRVLSSLQTEMRTAVQAQELQRFAELDRIFHRRLDEASGYERAVQETERLRDESDRYVAVHASPESRARESLDEHEAILAACEKGDSKAAARLIGAHIRRDARVLLVLVRDAEAGAPRTPTSRGGR